MPEQARTLTYQQAASFYNHLGARQDWQAFYEGPATRDLIAHASFETAQAIVEFGCGTGAFAEQILAHHLPSQATYLAVDSSETMVRLARSRLAKFGARVTIRQTDGMGFPSSPKPLVPLIVLSLRMSWICSPGPISSNYFPKLTDCSRSKDACAWLVSLTAHLCLHDV